MLPLVANLARFLIVLVLLNNILFLIYFNMFHVSESEFIASVLEVQIARVETGVASYGRFR